MRWMNSALGPFENQQWQQTFMWPGLILFGAMLFSLVVSGSFLFTVGVHPLSLNMALVPVVLAFGFILCLSAGRLWHWLTLQAGQAADDAMASAQPVSWSRLVLEGFQLLLFYFIVTTFLTSLTLLLYPVGWAIPLLLIVFHPLLFLLPVFARHDRSFLGLLDACLDLGTVLKHDYFSLWLDSTLYGILFGVLIYPVAMILSGLTGVGLFLLPGWVWAYWTGYGHLLTEWLSSATVQPVSRQVSPPPPVASHASSLWVSASPAPLYSPQPPPWQP